MFPARRARVLARRRAAFHDSPRRAEAALQLYEVFLVLALARTGLGIGAVIFAQPDARPWTAPFQGVAEVCCALLLRLYFQPGYREIIGAWAWPVFAYALVWSAAVWLRRVWRLAEEEDVAPQPSVLGTFGVAVEDTFVQAAGIAWHVAFVAPALVCGAFVLFGLVNELPH